MNQVYQARSTPPANRPLRGNRSNTNTTQHSTRGTREQYRINLFLGQHRLQLEGQAEKSADERYLEARSSIQHHINGGQGS